MIDHVGGLADLERKLGRFDDAEQCAVTALAMRQRLFGTPNAAVATASCTGVTATKQTN